MKSTIKSQKINKKKQDQILNHSLIMEKQLIQNVNKFQKPQFIQEDKNDMKL